MPNVVRAALIGSSSRSPAARWIAGLDDVAVVGDEPRAGGAGRLDGRLDDHAQQLVDVVGRGERLAEAGDRVAEAAALGVELVRAAPGAGSPCR